jgi:hypothetical protein
MDRFVVPKIALLLRIVSSLLCGITVVELGVGVGTGFPVFGPTPNWNTALLGVGVQVGTI